MPPGPLPPITDDDLVRVMNACTSTEVVNANEYYEFAAGPPMGRLMTHRLFEGPGSELQLIQLHALCQREVLARTKACETLPAV